MKTKFLAIIFLTAFLAGNLYASDQDYVPDETARNRVIFSAGFLSAEVAYERVFSSSFSLGAFVSYNLWTFADGLNAGIRTRWYPRRGPFFFDLGLGYSYGYNLMQDAAFMSDIAMAMVTAGFWLLSADFQNRRVAENSQRKHGLLIQPGMGWNIDLGRSSDFSLPLSINVGLDIRYAKRDPVLPFFRQRDAVLPFFRLGFAYEF